MKKKLVVGVVLAVMFALPLVARDRRLSKSDYDKYVAGYGDHPTVLVYGIFKEAVPLNNIIFYQLDSRLPASVIGRHEIANMKGHVYFGEALCGAMYKLHYMRFETAGYNHIYDGAINNASYLDFKAPQKTGIYYLGMRDRTLDTLLDDPDENKMRVDALKKMLKDYKGTNWEKIINEEIEKLQAQ